MRYVCMHKASPQDEAGTPPPPELIEGMGRLLGEMAQSGAFLGGEGLRPSSERFRLTLVGGGWEVTPGPLEGRNELPTGLALLQVGSVDEALAWARRYGTAVGARELQVGPLTEPWDFGMCPKPDGDVPLRFMILPMATRGTEAGDEPGREQRAALAKLTAEMQAAGVLASAEALQPSSTSVRLRYRGGERSVIDGPFAESNELIGGFCMMRMESLDEVLAFTDRFVDVVGGTCEMDVRPVDEGR